MLEHITTITTSADYLHLLKLGTLSLIGLYIFSFVGPFTGLLFCIFFAIFGFLYSIEVPPKRRSTGKPNIEEISQALHELGEPRKVPMSGEVKAEEISPFFEPQKIHQFFTQNETEKAASDNFRIQETSHPIPETKIAEDELQNMLSQIPEKPKYEPGSLSAVHSDSTQFSENEKGSLQYLELEEKAKLANKFEKLSNLEKQLADLEASFKGSPGNNHVLAEINRLRGEIGDINHLIVLYNGSFSSKSSGQVSSINLSRSEIFANSGNSLDKIPEGPMKHHHEGLSRSMIELGESISSRIDGLMNYMQDYFTRLLKTH